MRYCSQVEAFALTQTRMEDMTLRDKRIRIYIEAYERGSHDLKSINKWLAETGLKLVAKNGRVIEVLGL